MTPEPPNASNASEYQRLRRRWLWTVDAARERAVRRESTDANKSPPRQHRKPPQKTTTPAAGMRTIRHGVQAVRRFLGRTRTRVGQALPTPTRQARNLTPDHSANRSDPNTPTGGEQQHRERHGGTGGNNGTARRTSGGRR